MIDMIKVLFKQVYSIYNNNVYSWVLVLYNISANHYVGVPLNKEKIDNNDVYIKSINRYANISNTNDFSRNQVERPVYINGLPLKISDQEYNYVLTSSYNDKIDYLSKLNINVDNYSYIKWCKDKFILNNSDSNNKSFIQRGIYWVNFGINIGSEIRKLRPAILWRSTNDKNVWTVIPLTTKKKSDNYYFHYDLESICEGTAKIEDMRNVSCKRIISPYFYKNQIVIINNNDYNNIINIIRRYYTFMN